MRDARDANTDAEIIRASACLNAPDRYCAALFAPAQVRDDLIAVAAFDGEVRRIGDLVSDPALGSIRIAWWRDALIAGEGSVELSGNPVLDRFASIARRHQFFGATLDSYFDAQMDALFADPPDDDAALAEGLRGIDGAPFAWALQILAGSSASECGNLIDAAARASGATRLALTLPYLLAAGRAPLPAARSPQPPDQDWRPQIAWLAREAETAHADVRRQLTGRSREFTTALLPLALIEPYFRALQKPGNEPSRDIVEIAPLNRLWRIARAHWTGSL